MSEELIEKEKEELIEKEDLIEKEKKKIELIVKKYVEDEKEAMYCKLKIMEELVISAQNKRLVYLKKYRASKKRFDEALKENPKMIREAMNSLDLSDSRITSINPLHSSLITSNKIFKQLKPLLKTFGVEDKGGFDKC